MKIWILVTDQSSRGRVEQAAPLIAGDFHRWGVTSVEVNITSDPSKVPSSNGLRPLVPAEVRRRWSPFIALAGWMALALVWLLSRIPALVTGPAALLLVVTLLGGPFCGAWMATRPSH